MGCCPSKEQEPANQRQSAQKAPQKQAKIADPKKEPLLQHEHTANPQMPDTTIFDTTNHHSGSSDEKERDNEKTPAKANNSDDKSQKNGAAEQIKVSGQKPVRIEAAAPAEAQVSDIQVSHVIFEAPKPPLESLKPIIEENPPEMENLFSSSITEKRPAEDLVEQETEKESEEAVDHPGRKPDSAPIIYDAATGITSQGTYYPDPEDQRKYLSSFLPVVEQAATDDHFAQEIHENGVADPIVSTDHFVQNETMIVDTQGPVETSHETQTENSKSEIPESNQRREEEQEIKKEDGSDESKHLEVSEFLGPTKTQEVEVSLLVPAVTNEHLEVSDLVPEAHTDHHADSTEPKETEEKVTTEESAEVGHEVEDKSAEPLDVVPEPAESTAEKPEENSAEVANQPTEDHQPAAADPQPEDPKETPQEPPEQPKVPQQAAPLMADSGVFKSAAELTDSVFEEVVARKEPTNTNPEDPNHLFMSTVSELPAEPKAEGTTAEITESVVDFGTSSAVFGDSTENIQPGQAPAPEADQPAE